MRRNFRPIDLWYEKMFKWSRLKAHKWYDSRIITNKVVILWIIGMSTTEETAAVWVWLTFLISLLRCNCTYNVVQEKRIANGPYYYSFWSRLRKKRNKIYESKKLGWFYFQYTNFVDVQSMLDRVLVKKVCMHDNGYIECRSWAVVMEWHERKKTCNVHEGSLANEPEWMKGDKHSSRRWSATRRAKRCKTSSAWKSVCTSQVWLTGWMRRNCCFKKPIQLLCYALQTKKNQPCRQGGIVQCKLQNLERRSGMGSVNCIDVKKKLRLCNQANRIQNSDNTSKRHNWAEQLSGCSKTTKLSRGSRASSKIVIEKQKGSC